MEERTGCPKRRNRATPQSYIYVVAGVLGPSPPLRFCGMLALHSGMIEVGGCRFFS